MTKDRAIDQLKKLSQRADWVDPSRMPSGDCKDVTTHLAGIWLKANWGAVLEALRRLD